jgi:hypothetical protein
MRCRHYGSCRLQRENVAAGSVEAHNVHLRQAYEGLYAVHKVRDCFHAQVCETV